jgi:hypothetical protein
MWHDDCLYKTGPDLVIKRCVREDEIHDILQACHDDPYGGHFSDKRTAYKVLQSGYYCLILLEMLKPMYPIAMNVNEWVNLLHETKCHFKPK